MRRAALAVTGIVAGTTLLISLKSAPGASRLPDQVIADELAARRAAHPVASGSPSTVEPSFAGPAPAAAPTSPSGPSGGGDPPGPIQPDPPTATAPAPVPRPTPTRTDPPGAVVTGDSAFTEFGYVTVAITVSSGRITEVTAVEMPGDEPRSVSISERAAPILRQSALTAQSAEIDTVSGATWTSDAYRESLQSAITKAGLG